MFNWSALKPDPIIRMSFNFLNFLFFLPNNKKRDEQYNDYRNLQSKTRRLKCWIKFLRYLDQNVTKVQENEIKWNFSS